MRGSYKRTRREVSEDASHPFDSIENSRSPHSLLRMQVGQPDKGMKANELRENIGSSQSNKRKEHKNRMSASQIHRKNLGASEDKICPAHEVWKIDRPNSDKRKHR